MSRVDARSGGCQSSLEHRAMIKRMGTGYSHTDEITVWLEASLFSAHQGADALRMLWARLAASGKLPHDIDISDPDSVDWQRITDVLLFIAAFEQRMREDGLLKDGLWYRDETGQLVEGPLPTEEQLVH